MQYENGNDDADTTHADPDSTPESLFAPIAAVLEGDLHVLEDGEISFEQYMEPLLLDYSSAVLETQDRYSGRDPLTYEYPHSFTNNLD